MSRHTDYIQNTIDDLSGQYSENPWFDIATGNNYVGSYHDADIRREDFAQRMFMMTEQNNWSSAQEQMKRAKAAGINPLTAAAGIAGTDLGSSIPSSGVGYTGSDTDRINSVLNAVNGTLGAVSDVGNAITGGQSSLADAAFKRATQDPTIEKLRSDASSAFEKAGLDKIQAEIAGYTLKYADENAILDMQTKRVNIRRISQEYANLKAEHYNILKEYDDIEANIALKYSEKEVAEATRAKIAEDTRWIKAANDFWDSHGFLRDSNSNDSIIADLVANGIDPEPYMSSWISSAGRISGAVAHAEQVEITNSTYDRYIEQFRAENDYKRSDNVYQFLTSFVQSYSRSDIKQFREICDNQIDALFDKLETANDPSTKELYWSQLREFQRLRSMPRKQLKRYLEGFQ